MFPTFTQFTHAHPRFVALMGICFFINVALLWSLYNKASTKDDNALIVLKNEALQEPLPIGPAGTANGIYRLITPEDIPYLEEQKLKQ